MARVPLETFIFSQFDGSRISTESDHRILARGSANQIITAGGKPQAWKGLTVKPGLEGSLVLTNAGEGYAGLGSFGDTDVKGSVFRILSALFFVGNGALRFNGVSMGASAASLLQLKLLSGGSYAGLTYQAGLSQPVAPTLATLATLGTGFSGRLKSGTYSAKIIKIRSSTGVRSLASLQSNIIVVSESGGTGRSARITMPVIGANGADRWGIYVTPKNFGSTGPHYLLREVNEADLGTVDGVPRSLEIEWTDGDLVGQPLAPIDSFVPPAAVFGGVLGDTAFLDGCYGDVVGGVSAGSPGSTIVQSLPLRPEEYPPDFTIFPPEPPTALIRGGDGFYYRWGRSSMGVISNVGGDGPTLAFQTMWATTGIQYPHNATVGTGGRAYAKCGKTGFCRVGADGEPETSWANPVADIVKDWDDRYTVLGWDGDSHSLVAMNHSTLLVYNETQDKWGAPIAQTLAGDITAAVTQGNSLIIAAKDNGASNIKLYDYNTGTGSLMVSKTDWHFSTGESDLIRQIDTVMRADSLNPVQVDVYANEDDSAPVMTQTLIPPKTGTTQLQPIKIALPGLRSFSVKLAQQTIGGDAGFEAVRVTGSSNRINTL